MIYYKSSNERTKTATDTMFKNICFLSPGAPFSGFFLEDLCVMCIHQTDIDFPGFPF